MTLVNMLSVGNFEKPDDVKKKLYSVSKLLRKVFKYIKFT